MYTRQLHVEHSYVEMPASLFFFVFIKRRSREHCEFISFYLPVQQNPIDCKACICVVKKTSLKLLSRLKTRLFENEYESLTYDGKYLVTRNKYKYNMLWTSFICIHKFFFSTWIHLHFSISFEWRGTLKLEKNC